MIAARVLADSLSPGGVRLITLEVDCHRFILPELNTHRVLSRNSASSRAIPLARRIQEVRENPAMPIHWGRNRPGMSAEEELDSLAVERCRFEWARSARDAASSVEFLAAQGLHKQVAARILEPFLWHRVVLSGTDWEGFFRQRISPAAQPEMRAVAEAIRDAMEESEPRLLCYGEWHTPYVDPEEELDDEDRRLVSAARCARVSYLARREFSLEEDLELADRLLHQEHASPFEHVATPAIPTWPNYPQVRGNFRGWHQLRHRLGLV